MSRHDAVYSVIPLVFGAGLVFATVNNWGSSMYGDYIKFVGRAERFYWVDGLYPAGYPWLLRAAYRLTHDYLVAGKVLNILGAVSILFICAKTCAHLAPDLPVVAGVACQGVLISIPAFFLGAFTEGTDIPCVAFFVVGVHLLLSGGVESRGKAVLSGAAMGLAYLMRYTSLVPAMAMAAWIVVRARTWQGKAALFACFVFGFLLTASVQLRFSAAETGNPFYSQQVENVYFGVYGAQDWDANWGKWRGKGLLDLVRSDPTALLGNFLRQMRQSFALTTPLVLVALAATVLVCVIGGARRETRESVVFVMGLAIICAATVAIAFVNGRLLLPVLPLLSMPIAIAVAMVSQVGRERYRVLKAPSQIALALPLIAVALIVCGSRAADFGFPRAHQNRRISDALVNAGLQAPSEALTSGSEFYFHYSPRLERFTHLRSSSSPAEFQNPSTDVTVPQLEAVFRRERFRFLILEDRHGLRNWPGLVDLFESEQPPAFLKLLYREETPALRVVVYEIVGKSPTQER